MPLDGIGTKGQNFAPVKPLQDAKRSARRTENNPSSINAFFRELWQGLSSDYAEERREIIEQARIISQLRSGKLIMKRDLSGAGYVFLRPVTSASGRDRANYPLFPQNSEILTAKWQKARPTVRARHFGDGYKTEIQLNQVDTVIKSYFKNIFTSVYETREAYSAQDYGTYITQFEYDDKLNQMMQLAPVVQKQPKILVAGYGACYDCGFEGHPDDFVRADEKAYPQCAKCGSFGTSEMLPDTVVDEMVVTDVETITQGDITGRLLDFAASAYDPRVFAHESSYFLYSERVPLRLLGTIFGEDVNIEGASGDDVGFDVMDALAARGGNTDGLGANTFFGNIERFTEEGVMRSMWLKPEHYAGFKLSNSEQTLAGTIPAGVPFEELFPSGVCVRGFNEMMLQVGIYGEKANIASGVYLYQSHSGLGKGISDAVDTAKDLNEVYSMAMAGLKRYGASGLVVSKDAGLTQEDVRNLFKPRKAVFADTSMVGGDVNRLVTQVNPPVINPVLPQMMIQLSNMMNVSFMTGDFAQGAVQDVDINTFGGQQLAHAKAEEQKGAILTRKTFHREMSAGIIWDLFREHIKYPRYYAADDRHGKVRGKWISSDGMPEHIQFDAVPDSEIPENKFEKRLNAQEMIERAGGIASLAQAAAQDPRMTAWYTRLYGIDLPTLDAEEVQLVCLSRLSNIKDLSGVFASPEEILASLDNKLQVREASHILKAEFLQEILDDDEVQTWNPLALATATELIETHYKLEAEARVRDQMIAQQAQATVAAQSQQLQQQLQMQAQPMIAAQQQQQMQLQQQAQDAQSQDAMEQEVLKRAMDDGQKDADFERDQQAQAANHQRSLELEAARAAHRQAESSARVDAGSN